MPEPQPTEPTAVAATETPEPIEATPEPPAKDPAADAEKWKALARKHEAQAKANADKAKRFDELEEASKSELEKAIARAEAAEKAVQSREAEALRASIALEKGLTVSQAKRLVGSTREELEADAVELLADLKAATPKAPSADGQGKNGNPIGGPEQLTRADLEGMSADDIVRAKAEGRLDVALGIKTPTS